MPLTDLTLVRNLVNSRVSASWENFRRVHIIFVDARNFPTFFGFLHGKLRAWDCTKIIKWTRRTQLIKDNEMLRPPRPSCAKKPFYRTQSNAPIDYWYGGLILTKKFLFTDSAKFILSIFCRKSHFLQILENQQISIQFCYSTEGSLSRFKSYQSP